MGFLRVLATKQRLPIVEEGQPVKIFGLFDEAARELMLLPEGGRAARECSCEGYGDVLAREEEDEVVASAHRG